MKSENGNVFGGYTDRAWNKEMKWMKDENVYLFSLINKDDKPLKIKCSDPEFAAAGSSDTLIQLYGSLLVGGTDLALRADSNVNYYNLRCKKLINYCEYCCSSLI